MTLTVHHDSLNQRSSSRRIPSLDGLRALSIALVVLGHARNSQGFPHVLHILTFDAPIGVRIFFVISGFLISSLLLREQESTGKIDLKEFYRKRAYRILPAAIVAIVGITVIWHGSHAEALRSLLFVENFSPYGSHDLEHFWSLSVEEQFYLLWPFLLFRFPSRRKLIAVIGIISAALIRPVAFHYGHGAQNWFLCVEDSLFMGCLLAMLQPGDLVRVRRWVDRLILPIIAGMLSLLTFKYPPGVQPVIIQTLVNLLIVCFVDHCVRKKYWILNCRFISWIGTLSFSLYLWQMPFFPEIPRIVWYTYFPVAVALSFAAGLLSYYGIEKPFLKLRERRPFRAD